MIKTIDEYNELATMVDTAEETLESLRFGNHYLLSAKMAKHGIRHLDRKETIKAARKILDEFMAAYLSNN